MILTDVGPVALGITLCRMQRLHDLANGRLNDRDYPVVSAVNLFFATVVVVVNLLTDLLYASLDPRIRYE